MPLTFDAPAPTGKPAEPVTLAGTLIPWHEDRAVFANMPGTDDLFLLLFSDLNMLQATLSRADIPYTNVKRITDVPVFLADLPLAVTQSSRLRIALDARFLDNGRVRFVEIFRTDVA